MGMYQDVSVGEVIVTPGKTITEAAADIMTGFGGYIVPMFNDNEWAKKNTPFGGVIVPGEMTLFYMGGLAELSGRFDETVIALVGIDKVRFKTPVRPGDTVHLEMLIANKRLTSKGDKGLITFGWTCKNQDNDVVAEAEATLMFKA